VISLSCFSAGGGYFEPHRVHLKSFLLLLAIAGRVSGLRAFPEPEWGSCQVPRTAASATQGKTIISKKEASVLPQRMANEGKQRVAANHTGSKSM